RVVRLLPSAAIDDQAILQWQHYTRKRIKLMENAAAAQHQQQLQQSNGGEAATAGEATANGNGTASAAEAQPLGGSVQRGEPGQAQAVIPQQQQQQINGLATASNIKLELN
ncbi:mediator of RNA polymerase II transcription subunit 31-like, partial [Drosophila miranda]|uniref:mediator of RNA polymerase II transcription subunit 31-like n=1 Tax=Drosophila miranda TaxID=7229 RepID=UPI00143F1DCE